MKKYLLSLLLVLVSYLGFSQKGISYQAVILDPNKIEIPGQDILGQPLANENVWVKFTILSGSITQFEEVQQTKTDAYGLVNLLIGSVSSASFNALVWDATQKSLQVSVSFNQGASYTKVSDQKFSYTPYSLYAETAGKLGSTLGIAGGGTGATTAVSARANLGLGNVDNTADVDKPISTVTQAALNLKANTADLNTVLALKASASDLDLKASIASPTFTGTVSGITKSMVGLGSVDNTSDVSKPISTATQEALDTKVSTETFSSTLATKANTTDVNTALALKASASDLDLKAPIASPTFTGTVSGITKSMVGLGSVDNTADADKPISTATQAALDTKVSTETFSTTLATKANTTDVNTALALKASAADLDLKAPIASPTFTGTVSGITKSMVDLGSVDNTSDANKPVSTATQTALNLKLDATANAVSATKLATSRNINGVAFDGSVDITIAVDASTLSGTIAIAKGGTGATTPAGARTNLGLVIGTNVQAPLTAGTDYLTPTGSAANLTSFPTFNQSTTGNAATTTKLAIARNINGVAFDGSADITVAADASTLSGTVPVANGGTGTNNGSITGTSALTFAAGGANENISIKPSGTGIVFVGTGTSTPTSSSAILEASSTTQGFLPPRLTTTQRDAITTPVAGLTIWNITNTQLEVFDGSYWKNMVGLLVSPINVGDTYGGGKVFYIFGPSDNGYIKGQTHGLIAATEDQTTDAGVKWFPDKFYGATGTYIGLGLPNTLAIITSAIVTGTTNMSSFAAGLANSYRGGGNIDWFLPSKDELNLLYQAKDAIGGFATNQSPGASPAYWSSTQKGGISFTNFTSFANGVTSARLQFFNTGGSPVQQAGTITDTGIDNPRRVRAIRIF